MDTVKEFGTLLWMVGVAFVGAIAWLVRLEARVFFGNREIEQIKKQRDEDQAGHQRSRDETHGMLRDVSAKLDRLIERILK